MSTRSLERQSKHRPPTKRELRERRASSHARRPRSADQERWVWSRRRVQVLMCLATLGLMSLIFAPLSVWPIAFFCMVPWLVAVGSAPQAPRVYGYSYVCALGFFLLNMRWLYDATGWGYLALSVYQAAYFPFVAIAVRHVVRRRRWPLALLFPIIWTGSEMLRAVVISGFPWFFLAHSFHGVLTVIQISDLVGAYGVTFMAAAANGAIADIVLRRIAGEGEHGFKVRRSAARAGVIFAACIVAGVCVYGQIQLRRDTSAMGPKIAILQGDYVNSVYPQRMKEHDRSSDEQKMAVYLSMMNAAAREHPDVYLLPETPWIMYLNPEARDFFAIARRSFALLQEHARKNHAVVVTGSASYIPTPNDLLATNRRYNSATVFRPDGSEPQRYDKVHLVYFGETVPFRFGRLRFLYFWLNWLMPFSGPDGEEEYSVFPGKEFRRFSLSPASQPSREYHFGIPICYEDVMPYVSRAFVSGGADRKQADFLLNISNDGWFGRGIQQPQHLAICVFRAVENRVGIARAVNTGVSAFVDPTGRVHDVVKGDPNNPWPGKCGYAVANIGVDSRYTLYSRYGDWFAWSCAFIWLIVFLDYWILRVRERLED